MTQTFAGTGTGTKGNSPLGNRTKRASTTARRTNHASAFKSCTKIALLLRANNPKLRTISASHQLHLLSSQHQPGMFGPLVELHRDLFYKVTPGVVLGLEAPRVKFSRGAVALKAPTGCGAVSPPWFVIMTA